MSSSRSPSRPERRACARGPAGPGAFPRAVGLLALASLVASCAPAPSVRDEDPTAWLEARDAQPGDDVLLTVNGRPIDREEFYRRVLHRAGAHAMRQAVVYDELVRQEAERLEISVGEEEVDRAVERFLDGMAGEGGDRGRLEERLLQQGITLEEMRSDLIPQVRAEILLRKVVRARRRIDEDTLREYYRRTYDEKRYMTRHIAYGFAPAEGQTADDVPRLKLEALEKARRAIDRVREGHDFATIARNESDDEMTAEQGGALGGIREDSPLPPEFKEVIFALEPGEVSEPVENPRGPGVHVFQVTDVIPSQSYVDCVEDMRRELEEREPGPQELTNTLEELRRDARIDWSAGGELARGEAAPAASAGGSSSPPSGGRGGPGP